jgi:hypothetical protein
LGTIVIQVRSEPESQEWEVIVDPSAEASRPTRMLVQESNSGAGPRLFCLCPGPARMARVSRANTGADIRKRRGFLTGALLSNDITARSQQFIARRSGTVNFEASSPRKAPLIAGAFDRERLLCYNCHLTEDRRVWRQDP